MSKSTPQSTIAHMNKSHRLALEDYLYAYGNVPITNKIANVRLLNIDLNQMTIQFNHFDVEFEIEKTIVFSPPLKDWSESRERLVLMSKEAAKKRGLSHLQINEMLYPTTPFEYFLIFLIFCPIIGLSNPLFLDYLYLPTFLKNKYSLIGISFITLTLHLFECIFILKPKLDFYRVPIDFCIEWYLFGMIDGLFTVSRFNKLVKSKEH